MKKKQIYFKLSLLLITIVFINNCKIHQLNNSDKKYEPQFQTIIDSIYNAHKDVKGIMVHIEYPNKKISWSGAIGYSDYHKKTKIQEDQPALIASTIKPYVSASILRLVEEDFTTIDAPIENIISKKSKELLQKDGYDLKSITIKHLLSHTSGIQDYVHQDYVNKYFDFITENKKHRWTREEQIKLTVDVADPIGKAGDTFNYADANYLLLTEIIEHFTEKTFYSSMRELLYYSKLNLNSTWFYTLEKQPKNTKPLVHQYFGKYNWDSYEIDPSFDLYGGGGIACTTKDLAQFFYHYFNGNIVKNKKVKDLIFTSVTTKDNKVDNYFLGLTGGNVKGLQSYGHGGFWGTVVQYFPEIDASIAVYVLERDQRILRKDILEHIVEKLKKI